jgi:DeoR/GlpR family transcriptional regulator of sugar metabolism
MDDTRRNTILSLLKKHKKMCNSDLQHQLYCSTSTLRRELIQLEKEGLIRRYRGGAVLEVEQNHTIALRYRENVMVLPKKHIAEIASTFMGAGTCIFVDSSSTVKTLLPYLNNLSNCVILTNGLLIAYELLQACCESTKIYMIGGEVIRDAESVIGDYGNSFLEIFNIDLFFLSSTGLDTEGVYEANFSQALFKKKVMRLANQTILLVDHTKFGKKHAYKFSDLSAFESIITDAPPPSEYLRLAENSDTEVLY